MIFRRNVAISIAVAAFTPLPSRAQQPMKVWRIGMLSRSLPRSATIQALFTSLNELGYQEGRNLIVERRLIEPGPDRRPAMAAELANLGLDLVIAPGDGSAQAMRAASATIPIVMPWSVDPVGTGLAASLARPGGNITGLTIDVVPEQWGKSLQLFKEMLPAMRTLAVIWDGTISGQMRTWDAVQAAAKQLGIGIRSVELRAPNDLMPALEAIRKNRTDAMWVWAGPSLDPQAKLVAEFAIRDRMAAFAAFPAYVELGCLMAYSVNFMDLHRRAAMYVDRIFKGAKPADLPIEQPSAFDLVVNRKTGDAIGLPIPQSILLQANRLID